MASLWKHPNSKFWTACWTDGTGRRAKRSTKTTDKKLAQKLADQFEEESRGRPTANQARRVLTDIYRRLAGKEMPTTTVREYLASFVNRKRPEVAPATLAYYEGHARRFLEWLGTKADLDIAEITSNDITGYRNHHSSTAGPRTTNNTVKAIRGFFAAAKKDGFLNDDPATAVDTIRDRSESNRRSFTLDELRAAMAVADDEWRSMILFGLYTGQRLSDIASLTWQNIDTVRNEIRLTTRKTGRRQALPLPHALQVHLSIMDAGDDPKAHLHPHCADILEKKGSATKLSLAFAGILSAAGLRSAGKAEGGFARARHELSFHSLRHTATSMLKDAGIPQSVVMDYIGHDSADVSAGYTHTGREALEKAAAAFPHL